MINKDRSLVRGALARISMIRRDAPPHAYKWNADKANLLVNHADQALETNGLRHR
jgi:hypothetical protein